MQRESNVMYIMNEPSCIDALLVLEKWAALYVKLYVKTYPLSMNNQ